LHLSGFLSYLDPVDIEFDSFDLACISVQNGAGKSSLLDAITWALFGEARRRDDAIINNRAEAAEVILTFNYEGNRYRIQRTKPKNKTTLLEFAIQDGNENWRVLTEPTLRATEELVRKTLRLDYETFTNASFFLQGKADQFAQQKPSDRKRILSSILGLDIWDAYKDETAPVVWRVKNRSVSSKTEFARSISNWIRKKNAKNGWPRWRRNLKRKMICLTSASSCENSKC
jgi:exonuclease SbcC